MIFLDVYKFKLTITYDMVWKNIFFEMQYKSISNHAFIVGGLSKALIGIMVYSNYFRAFDKT